MAYGDRDVDELAPFARRGIVAHYMGGDDSALINTSGAALADFMAEESAVMAVGLLRRQKSNFEKKIRELREENQMLRDQIIRNNMKPEMLLGSREVARILNVSQRTVANYVSQGRLIPAFQVNPRGHLRFHPSEIEKFRVHQEAPWGQVGACKELGSVQQ